LEFRREYFVSYVLFEEAVGVPIFGHAVIPIHPLVWIGQEYDRTGVPHILLSWQFLNDSDNAEIEYDLGIPPTYNTPKEKKTSILTLIQGGKTDEQDELD
jgi:hypothetical protein